MLFFATAILVKRATFEKCGLFRTVDVKNEKIVRTQMGTSVCQTKCLWRVIHCEFTEGIDLDLLVFYRLCQLFCFHCDKGILLLHTGNLL